VFPELKNQFDLFDHSLPIANTSMQHMYHALQGMVRPLRQQDDALRPAQLREGQRHFANLGQQWGAQLQSTSGAIYFPLKATFNSSTLFKAKYPSIPQAIKPN
jgi:hypothetical protein